MGEPTNAAPVDLDMEMVKEINEYIWVMEDTPEFIAGRISAAARRSREHLLPPFFGELVRFSKDFEYSWHTPGHAGGIALLKSPAGRAFHTFFGEQTTRSDLKFSRRAGIAARPLRAGRSGGAVHGQGLWCRPNLFCDKWYLNSK